MAQPFHVCVGLCTTTKSNTQLIDDTELAAGQTLDWDEHINDLIEEGTIDQEGVYITWVWEYSSCPNCAHVGGVNVGINMLYTVRKDKHGKLMARAGAPLLQDNSQRLTTWPPKK
jgi:hypothetical protein